MSNDRAPGASPPVSRPPGTFKVVAESPELIKPDPFPKGYQ